jgi:hypothetical protein
MLAKKLVPFKFLAAILEIVIAGVLLSTAQVYPTLNGTTQTRYFRLTQFCNRLHANNCVHFLADIVYCDRGKYF